MHGGTILIESITRERLKRIGRKDQTYDQIINELIKLRNRNPSLLESDLNDAESTESVTYGSDKSI
jgi:hypothetical protein